MSIGQYDQTALELCKECGWRAMIPGEGCLTCARQKAKPVAWFHEEKYKTHFTTDPSEDMIGKYWQPLYTAPQSINDFKPDWDTVKAYDEKFAEMLDEQQRLRAELKQAKRQWVGLTDEEVNDCIKLPSRNLFARDGTTSQRIARAIEAKLKEKNT